MKRLATICSFFIFLSFLLFFPKHALVHAKAGVMLWFYTLLLCFPFSFFPIYSFTQGFWITSCKNLRCSGVNALVFPARVPMLWYLVFSAVILWEPKLQRICMKSTGFPKKKPPISLPFPLIQVPPFCLHTCVPGFLTVHIW